MVVDEDILVDYLNTLGKTNPIYKDIKILYVENISLLESTKEIFFNFHAIDDNGIEFDAKIKHIKMIEYENYAPNAIRRYKINKLKQRIYGG